MKNNLDEWNGLNEIVYLADTDTYEVIFVNDCGLKAFGYSSLEEVQGKKCYRMFQGLDGPCPYCTNRLLSADSYTEWEHVNPVTGRCYLIKDRLRLYNGRYVRMEIALDVTYVENERRLLKNTLINERIVLECIRMMHSDTDIDTAIRNTLQMMGTALQSDRTYIFEFSGHLMDNTYEWCAPNITAEIDSLKGLSLSEITRWMEIFERKENVIIHDLEDYRESEPAEYARLSAQHIHTLVTVPLMDHSRVIGFFGVDNPPVEKLRNISDILTILAYFFQSLLASRDTSNQMRHLSLFDSLTGAMNRNAFIRDISRADASGKNSGGVIFLDVNGLKQTNDQHGHTAGDQLLIQVYQAIEAAFSTYPSYRTGGDEFVVLCDAIPKSIFINQTAILKKALTSGTDTFAAIGAAWTNHMKNLQTLINEAESYMYEDKKHFYKTSRKFSGTVGSGSQNQDDSLSESLLDEASLKKLCYEILTRYFCEKDTDYLMKYTSASFTFMEESHQKLYSRQEAEAYFRHQATLLSQPSLQDITISTRRLSKGLWLCCDMAYLDTTLSDGTHTRVAVKNGRIFQKEGDSFTCLFVHSSNAS